MTISQSAMSSSVAKKKRKKSRSSAREQGGRNACPAREPSQARLRRKDATEVARSRKRARLCSPVVVSSSRSLSRSHLQSIELSNRFSCFDRSVPPVRSERSVSPRTPSRSPSANVDSDKSVPVSPHTVPRASRDRSRSLARSLTPLPASRPERGQADSASASAGFSPMTDSPQKSLQMEEKTDELDPELDTDTPMAVAEDCVYLNGVKGAYDDNSVRKEIDRVFPGLVCRALCLGPNAIMLKGFKSPDDAQRVMDTDWSKTIDGKLPFGGVQSSRRSELASKETLVRTVRMVVNARMPAERVKSRLLDGDFGDCTVEQVGSPFVGMRALRVVMPSEEKVNAIVGGGFWLDDQRTEPVPWIMHQSTRLCSNCWRQHSRKSGCRSKRVCGRCSRGKRQGETACPPYECRSRLMQCPNCSEPHAATSIRCRYKHEILRKCAKRTGLPQPLCCRAPVPCRSHRVTRPACLNGRSYAAVSRPEPPQAVPMLDQIAAEHPRVQVRSASSPKAETHPEILIKTIYETVTASLAPIVTQLQSLVEVLTSTLVEKERTPCEEKQSHKKVNVRGRALPKPGAKASSKRGGEAPEQHTGDHTPQSDRNSQIALPPELLKCISELMTAVKGLSARIPHG